MFDVPQQAACPFCSYLDGNTPCAFVVRDELVSAFMNRTQYEKGAVLLVPNRHLETILDLDAPMMQALYLAAQRLARGMMAGFGAVGLNMFQNNGTRANQTIPHFHVHLVPRYADSDPSRIFSERDFAHAPLSELERRAGALRRAMSAASPP